MKCAPDGVVTFLNITCWMLLSRSVISEGPADAVQPRQGVCLSVMVRGVGHPEDTWSEQGGWMGLNSASFLRMAHVDTCDVMKGSVTLRRHCSAPRLRGHRQSPVTVPAFSPG